MVIDDNKWLTADLSKDVASSKIQEIFKELVGFTNNCNGDVDMEETKWICCPVCSNKTRD